MYKNNVNIEILVIEDNLGDFVLIEDYIEEMFLSSKITHSKSFKDAKTFLLTNTQTFDLILLDVTLPDKQGIHLINELLAIVDRCPVLILTGYENLDFSMQSLQLGISDYLLKDELNAYSLYKSILFSIERKNQIKKIEDSEKRYSDMFQLNPIPLWVVELESLNIINVNKAAVQQYGYSEQEFLEMSILALFQDQMPNILSRIKETEIQSNIFATENFINVKKSGELINVKIEINRMTLDGKECCILLANDLTELLKTQNSLRIANQNIIDIEEKEKERFASEIHDGVAQNLIATQLIFSILIESHPELKENPHVPILTNSINTAIKECSDLVQDVRPKLLIDFGFRVALDQLIEKTKLAGQFDINIDFDFKLEKVFNYSDLLHLYRLIQELFNNVIKYAKATFIKISINKISDEIQLSFSDNGIGVPEASLNKSSSFLSLKKRVQILNGNFKVESVLDKGTNFYITIPVNKC